VGFCWRSRASTRHRDRAQIAPSNRIQCSYRTLCTLQERTTRFPNRVTVDSLLTHTRYHPYSLVTHISRTIPRAMRYEGVDCIYFIVHYQLRLVLSLSPEITRTLIAGVFEVNTSVFAGDRVQDQKASVIQYSCLGGKHKTDGRCYPYSVAQLGKDPSLPGLKQGWSQRSETGFLPSA
jgi:hypothetical protein